MQNQPFLIVGGGLLGCAVALELAQAGASVVVLEKAIVGAEASSAAAGILAPRMEAHGLEPFRSFGIESLELYPRWVAEIEARAGISVGYFQPGLLRLVLADEDPDAVRPDVDATWLDTVPAPLGPARGAWSLPKEATVDPAKLVQAVHAAAAAAGARFRAGLEVARVQPDGVLLRTKDGREGDFLPGRPVVCAGAWTGVVAGLHALPVQPIRGQLMRIRASVPHVVFGPRSYLVPRQDGTTIVGTTVEEVGFERGVTVAGLATVTSVLLRMAPALKGAIVEHTWSSFRPGTPDGLPVLGEVNGVMVASGHFRNGILLAPWTGRMVAAALLHGAQLPSAYAPGRFSS